MDPREQIYSELSCFKSSQINRGTSASMVGSQGFTYAEKGAVLQEFHPPETRQ